VNSPEFQQPQAGTEAYSMTRYGVQFRVAKAFLDFVSGLDPSGAGLVRALVTLIPTRGGGPKERP
jgi:hypothetical protein